MNADELIKELQELSETDRKKPVCLYQDGMYWELRHVSDPEHDGCLVRLLENERQWNEKYSRPVKVGIITLS